jgi:hypothetical protein
MSDRMRSQRAKGDHHVLARSVMRFAVLADGLTEKQSYRCSTFCWRCNNAVMQTPLTSASYKGGPVPASSCKKVLAKVHLLSWR